jgi:hypothetical protein
MPKIPLPEVIIVEFTPFRPFTAPGLFAYRNIQALNLLEFPDYSGVDLNETQRRDALRHAVELYRPLSALVIFLSVAGLEDFIRDFGARLADHPDLAVYFPSISELRMKPVKPKPDRPFARLDTDPIVFTDPAEVNKQYKKCLGVEPFQPSEHAKLRDLALLRHTVAHHGAIIRSIDVPRFQHYVVKEGQPINPPIIFVREVCDYLYQIGRTFEKAVKNRIFSVIIPRFNPLWWEQQPPILLDLLELFNYFGYLVSSDSLNKIPTIEGAPEEQKRMEGEQMKEKLIRLCIDELKQTYVTTSTA